MAPYNPPDSHYAHLKVDLYDELLVQKYMGKRGQHFYDLTTKLGMRYIWYNKEKKIIEVWGPYNSFKDNNPIDVIHQDLEKFVSESAIDFEDLD